MKIIVINELHWNQYVSMCVFIYVLQYHFTIFSDFLSRFHDNKLNKQFFICFYFYRQDTLRFFTVYVRPNNSAITIGIL